MVIDKIENYRLYSKLTKRLAKGFEFITETDLVAIESGKHQIDNDDVFAIVQEYDTKEEKDCILEGHHKYIDIQYVIQGVELMGFTPLTNQVSVEEDLEKDYTFYNGETSMIRVEEGMFTIFFPEDLHRPCVKAGQISKVKKVVVKVKI
ncbi:YhcH/YjgK/YiaL family protein [Flavobacterium sp. M31R6]|uniref:YhcH/YjgK/YiaL family protein n=1 Tax=Flavobacterium sp. M31R6 TaxID=2739062 RepID=UPI0015693482|nr:YhcH/YjgK/YiaL family protein [Flavobacterium sp. M31R6]QKJ63757.1 YhcH/YjgK/YiaL family protein [Flavobacterium sp. M31R6]